METHSIVSKVDYLWGEAREREVGICRWWSHAPLFIATRCNARQFPTLDCPCQIDTVPGHTFIQVAGNEKISPDLKISQTNKWIINIFTDMMSS